MTKIEVVAKFDNIGETLLVINPGELKGLDRFVTDGASVYEVIQLLPGGDPDRIGVRTKQLS